MQIIEVCLVTRAENGGLIALPELLRRLRQLRGRRATAAAAVSAASAQSNNSSAIVTSDVVTAIEKVKVLGNGFRLVSVSGATMVLSVPTELSTDTIALLSLSRKPLPALTANVSSTAGSTASATASTSAGAGDSGAVSPVSPTTPGGLAPAVGAVTVAGAAAALGWDRSRALRGLQSLLKEGLCWLELQQSSYAGGDGAVTETYWFPGVWQEHRHRRETEEEAKADAAAEAEAAAAQKAAR